jgi:hypothetical protein
MGFSAPATGGQELTAKIAKGAQPLTARDCKLMSEGRFTDPSGSVLRLVPACHKQYSYRVETKAPWTT